jgi:hypothetical protein
MTENHFEVILKFVAKNPPSILILAGVLGWILCGFTNINIFCNYWLGLIIIGIVIQVLWMLFKFKPFE